MNDGDIAGREATADALDAYRVHRQDLIRFATILVGPHDAADVVSAAMVRILERDPGPLDAPRAYLYRAVGNQARNLMRGEARCRRREARAGAERSTSSLPEPYPEVREAIEGLSVRQRAVVFLTYWEDMTEETIARHLGIGSGSVRRHLARARRHLRRELDEDDG